MALKILTPPAAEPITLSEAKERLRVTHDAEDAVILSLITSARDLCEQETGRALMPQTWQQTYDNFPEAIELPKLPVVSVTALKYTGSDGNEYTLSSASYVLDNASDDRSAWVVPAIGYQWPETYEGINGVRVEFVCGYDNADLVPAALKQWMLLQIGNWYENRKSIMDGTYSKLVYTDNLLNPFRVWSI